MRHKIQEQVWDPVEKQTGDEVHRGLMRLVMSHIDQPVWRKVTDPINENRAWDLVADLIHQRTGGL